jgi:hypothetical protein
MFLPYCVTNWVRVYAIVLLQVLGFYPRGTILMEFVTMNKIATGCCRSSINKQKQTPWPLVRERTIPTERSQFHNRKKIRVKRQKQGSKLGAGNRKPMFEIVITLKNGVFWDVTPCGCCKNRSFGGTWRLLHQGDKNRWTRNNATLTSKRLTLRRISSVRRLLVTK